MNNHNHNMMMGGHQQEKPNEVDRIVKINQIKFIILKLAEIYKGNEQVERILSNSLNLVAHHQMEGAADELQVSLRPLSL